jgi:tetratricopeptide (TPR) repeat protein
MTRWMWLTGILFWTVAAGLCADDASPAPSDTPPSPTEPIPAAPQTAEPEGIAPQQPADDVLLPLTPLKGRSEADQRRLESLAHFMAGELFLERGGDEAIGKALRELSQAIELNPAAIEPYRLYIPAAVRQGEFAGAQKYALLSTEKTAEGVQLLRALVAVYVQQGQIDRAVEVLEASQAIPGLEPKSFARLILNRHLGQCYALGSQMDKAAETYRQLFAALQPEPEQLTADERTQLFGERGELYEDIGNALLAAKQPEQAFEAYRISADKHGRSPGLHSFNLAQVFHQTGKPERAIEELEHYFAAHHVEKGRAPYQLFKDLLKEVGREQEFFPRLEKLAAEDKGNKFLQHFLAGELVAQGKLDPAEKIYSEMGGLSDPEALLGLASIYRRQGKFDLWIKTGGRTFVVLQLNNSTVRERLNEENREMGDRFTAELKDLAHNQEQADGVLKVGREQSSGADPQLEFESAWLLGRLAIESQRVDDAAHFYRYAIGMQNLPSYDLFRELGAFFIDQKKYDDAEKTFQDAADHPALEPLRFFFLSLVSVAQEMDGRIEEALKAIQETRRLAPNEPQFAVQEARIYYRARRWDEAIDVFESILRDFREDAETIRECRFSLSAVLVQKGEYDRGEQILLDILAEEPEHPQANNDLGYLWADRNKNLEQARVMIAKALAAEPENAAYMDSMGWILYRLGEYAEAEKHLVKASSEPRGEDSTIFDHLGDVRAKLGQADEAAAAWRRALELEWEKPAPDPKMIESLRSKLPTEVPAAPKPESSPDK